MDVTVFLDGDQRIERHDVSVTTGRLVQSVRVGGPHSSVTVFVTADSVSKARALAAALDAAADSVERLLQAAQGTVAA